MKKSALIFGVTADYDFALANTLIGLKKHSPGFVDDVIVFHSGIPKERQSIIQKIVPCQFKFYSFPTKYKYQHLQEKLGGPLATYSILAFSRFQAFDMLEQYSRIVWLDVDILIQKDITELLYLADSSGIALSQSDQLTLNLFNFSKAVPGFDMYRILYNSGTIVFSDSIRERSVMTDWCYEATFKYADYCVNADQCIINMLVDNFDIIPTHIDTHKYVCHPLSPKATNASIIHSWGADKFWNSEQYMKLFPEWSENNKIWLSLLDSKHANPQKRERKSQLEAMNSNEVSDKKNCEISICSKLHVLQC